MKSLLNNRHFLGLLFMLPAAALLLVFLTYPLGLGTWLGFTDAKIGRAGHWIGISNFQYLAGDSVARLSLFNTLFYTVVASVLKFALGLLLFLVVLIGAVFGLAQTEFAKERLASLASGLLSSDGRPAEACNAPRALRRARWAGTRSLLRSPSP